MLLNGPVIVDLIGCDISTEESDMLQHPLVGGVILFSRNYESPEQIKQLCKNIRKVRKKLKPILITVDHEGGRVQRFREGFTHLVPMGQIGEYYEKSPAEALQLAHICGQLIACELLAVGVDLSFAPVLDLNKIKNPAIGDRAFHAEPKIVIPLAKAIMQGMHMAGMAATGKHFPGHGSVSVDSHRAMPEDKRELSDIYQDDILPFAELIQADIEAIMPAHIVFPLVDNNPVGFSRHWLQDILRGEFKFSGVIFSDDLNMEGAGIAGDYANRAEAALQAGCDMVLICNNRAGAIQILDRVDQECYLVSDEKFNRLRGKQEKAGKINYLKLKDNYEALTLALSHEWERGD